MCGVRAAARSRRRLRSSRASRLALCGATITSWGLLARGGKPLLVCCRSAVKRVRRRVTRGHGKSFRLLLSRVGWGFPSILLLPDRGESECFVLWENGKLRDLSARTFLPSASYTAAHVKLKKHARFFRWRGRSF